MLKNSYEVLNQLRLPNGLYLASSSDIYHYVWIRDCVYMSMPYLDKTEPHFEKTYYRLLDMFQEYEWKLDILQSQKPTWEWEYIHARYSANDVKEIHHQNWGHIQHDMMGAFLFAIGNGIQHGKQLLRNEKDREIIQKIVYYLDNIQYWNDPDNGMWEEWREVHLSSVGACVAGLKAVQPIVHVPEYLIDNGIQTLLQLFPRESNDKQVDLAQLSLIYPYRLFSGVLAEKIIDQVEKILLRSRGVIRYEGDSYFSTLEKSHGRTHPREFYYGSEAEWTFGLPWLALCHLELNNISKAKEYIEKTEYVMTEPGVLPELYYSRTDIPNENTPLGWSSAMYILAKEAFIKKSELFPTEIRKSS